MKKYSPQPVPADPDLPQLERNLLKHWYKSGIVKQYLEKNDQSKKYFSFLDGPITANNPMGVHHAWGRTYKDLWQRFYNLLGYKQRFQNGFDSQGLWVEVEVEKELGFKSKKDIEKYGVEKFVNKCKQRVKKFAAIQTEQSKRLGYFMDWDHSYFTMSDANNYMIWHFLKICEQNGWLYKGRDSVPWCPRCETAISQHEMLTEDYKLVTHESVYFTLPLLGKDEYLLVWTTTPWTIPANIAVAVDEKLKYSLIEVSGKKYWLAQESIKRVFSAENPKILKTLIGKKLVGLKYKGPFDHLPAVSKVSKESPSSFHTVIPTDSRILPISTEEGTGMVHTAVSAGSEDFNLGKKLNLPMIPVIKDNADYLEGLGFLSGKNAKKHPELILNYLKTIDQEPGQHWIYKIENYQHRYPACWRCKYELVWKVTEEWYIAMDKGKPSLRQRMKRVAKKINWIPAFGLDRELDWLNNMHDWLISKKNRYWGLCLPIWDCRKCGTYQVIGSLEELKTKAVSGWQQFAGKSPHKPQIDKVKLKCPKCGELVSRIEPVGNPWLDAGIVPFSTITKENQSAPLYNTDRSQWRKWFPADFITESFPGQFKNWFYSMIAMSTVLENTNPYKTVLGFGTLLGEDGRPMHKSWGNAIEFKQGADTIGVDVMRWMYVRHDPAQNLLFGIRSANLVRRQFHLIIWNSYRYVTNNLISDKIDYVPSTDSKNLLDLWILSKINRLAKEVMNYLKIYDAQKSALLIEEFVNDFSTWYIRRSRERTGTLADKKDKIEFYNTSAYILINLSKLLAPFIPFLSDLIYTNLTGDKSVHLTDWPDFEQKLISSKIESDMRLVREIVELGHSQRKELKIKVRQPLLSMTINGISKKLEKPLIQLIKDELNIKEIKFVNKGKDIMVNFDTRLTDDLIAEGEAREFIRKVQQERKRLGLDSTDTINLVLPKIPQGFKKEIMNKTLARSLKLGSQLKVEPIS